MMGASTEVGALEGVVLWASGGRCRPAVCRCRLQGAGAAHKARARCSNVSSSESFTSADLLRFSVCWRLPAWAVAVAVDGERDQGAKTAGLPFFFLFFPFLFFLVALTTCHAVL